MPYPSQALSIQLCEVWFTGTTNQRKEGDTIIFSANVPHALFAITRFKMMLIMIRK
jgi:quercetin dioxygenase-like cupin family protein